MNTYRCFFNGKQEDIEADRPVDAQLAIARKYKIRKTYNVTVVLLAVGDREIIHSPAEFG